MDPVDANAARKPARGPSLRRIIAWTLWLCLAAWLLIRLPHEVSYWMLALAEKASLEGRTDEALQWVERAKPWTPDSPLPYDRQAQLLARDKKSDPLAAADLLLSADPPNKIKARLHLFKSSILRDRGKHEKALESFDAAANFEGDLRPSTDRLELLLLADERDEAKRELAQVADALTKQGASDALIDNTVAYFSGLMGEDLEDSLQRAERAVKAQPDDPAILDTRGYLLHRLGRNEQALPDLERSIELLEKSGVARSSNTLARKAFAVIVYHRSLVLDALEKSAEAERDRDRVRELGFEPSERLF